MFGVTADNERGCDSSELHILYLSNFLYLETPGLIAK